MWTDDDVIDIIRAHPALADNALRAIQQGVEGVPLGLDSFVVAAEVLRTDAAALCISQLREKGLLEAFVEALRASGVDVDTASAGTERINLRGMTDFLQRAVTFRCRVEVDDVFTGSGCLVGPGLVLTAWHVVRTKGPGIMQNPEPRVSVTLADGSTHDVRVPPSYASPCGDGEWLNEIPQTDADVQGRHDVALLALGTPAARHLGFVRLPAVAPPATPSSRVFLLDFPLGQDGQLGTGTTRTFPNVTARLLHDIETGSGSSGGACFNGRFEFLGLHQGRNGKYGRFVPLSLFLGDLADLVTSDIAPTELWHLDGQSAQLVIARDLFVAAVAEAGNEATRVRGIRVKRRKVATGDETGLGFSFRILSELLMRRGSEHIIVRIPLDEPVPDLVADISARARSAGTALITPPSPGGVEPALTASEAAARDQANQLAIAMNQAAASTGRMVWFFIDNPSVPLSEAARLDLEGFVASCLNQPRLRVVVAGLETVPLAGLEFSSPAAASGAGPAGMVVDFVGGFTRADVLNCLTRAAEDVTGRAAAGEIALQADLALQGLNAFNGVHDDADLGTVVTRLQPYLELLHERGGRRP